MTEGQTLKAILDRLTAIERQLAHLNNPLAHVSIQEQGEALRKAIASGDKAQIKAVMKGINGGRSLQ